MTPKILFSKYFQYGYKKTESDADLESVEKVAKKFTNGKFEGRELLYTSTTVL
jgi:hypothetical protein